LKSQRNNFGYAEDREMYLLSKRMGRTVKYLLRFAYLLAFIAVLTLWEHYVNSFWPPQQVVVVSDKSKLPVPTPTSTPLTLEQQFQPYAEKLCSETGPLFKTNIVQRFEVQDNKTTAYVYCMQRYDHVVVGPYEIGL